MVFGYGSSLDCIQEGCLWDSMYQRPKRNERQPTHIQKTVDKTSLCSSPRSFALSADSQGFVWWCGVVSLGFLRARRPWASPNAASLHSRVFMPCLAPADGVSPASARQENH